MSCSVFGAETQARHHGHVLDLQFVAVIRALAVSQIEDVGKIFLRVVFGTDVFLLVRAIGPGAFSRVVNPAHQIVVVRLFSHARKIRREACHPAIWSPSPMEWHARQPRVSNSSLPCAALPGFAAATVSVKPDCQMYAEIA